MLMAMHVYRGHGLVQYLKVVTRINERRGPPSLSKHIQ